MKSASPLRWLLRSQAILFVCGSGDSYSSQVGHVRAWISGAGPLAQPSSSCSKAEQSRITFPDGLLRLKRNGRRRVRPPARRTSPAIAGRYDPRDREESTSQAPRSARAIGMVRGPSFRLPRKFTYATAENVRGRIGDLRLGCGEGSSVARNVLII
jgi:hypothetical protein